MAIKVKHEGSAASRMAASAAGGAAKRAMEAAALAKPSQIQTLQPAHASAPGVSAPHAPLIAAPGGGAHAQLIGGGGGIGATARLGGGGGGRGGGAASRVAGSGGMGDSGDYKVTGTSYFDRPDNESVWNDQTRQWIRRWLPGEKEAEARQRIGEVENGLVDQRELTAQGRRERAALVGDVVQAIKQGRFSKEEIPALLREAGMAEENIRLADSLRDREPTPEEAFRKNTFTDQNGVVFSRDGKVMYNPNDTEIRRQEFAAKQLDALKARADKFRAELMKPMKLGKDAEGNDQIKMRSPEEVDELMKRFYPDLYPSVPASTGGPGAQSPSVVPPTEGEAPAVAKTVEDAKKKWGVKR